MKYFIRNPLFILGLLIRISILFFVIPQAVLQWYAPFLELTTQHLTINPWGEFLSAGGAEAAFPYGYVMWIVFLPLSFICNTFSIPLHFAYGFTLLAADIGLLFLLKKLLQTNNRTLLLAYWLSPIILVATYWFGFNDLIPVFFLYLALYFARRLKWVMAGVFCGIAISAKFSMVLVVPLFCIYLFRNRALRSLLPNYAMGLGLAAIFFFVPFIFFSDGLFMLANNPEMSKIYQFVLQIGEGPPIYLLPLLYLLMLYVTWRIKRISFELFSVLLGLSFFIVVLLTPASLGWFVWIVPLLVLYQTLSDKMEMILVGLFSMLYMVTCFLPQDLIGSRNLGILHTFFLVIGIILIFRIGREAIGSNNYFRLSRKPFAIGIAGDSGSGKDTLAHLLIGLFGKHSVTQLSGDDYHLWDRQKPMWQVMTHLNPRANDLEQYAHDLIALSNGKTIYSRRYDHESGKMTHPYKIKSNDFIIATGLHALYLPILRNCYNFTIYLDIDEKLRHYFKLQRDVHVRGHSVETVLSALAKREADSSQFVRPQAMHADLIMSLQPIHPHMLDKMENIQSLRFKLFARSRYGLNEEALLRVLIGVCGLHVDMVIGNDNSGVDLTIEGEASAEDIALAATTLCPRISEFLDITPKWQEGVKGLMQLITLSHINQSLREQLI